MVLQGSINSAFKDLETNYFHDRSESRWLFNLLKVAPELRNEFSGTIWLKHRAAEYAEMELLSHSGTCVENDGDGDSDEEDEEDEEDVEEDGTVKDGDDPVWILERCFYPDSSKNFCEWLLHGMKDLDGESGHLWAWTFRALI